MRLLMFPLTALTVLAAAWLTAAEPSAGSVPAAPGVFAKDNLVAWCIVPFDAKDRSPKERAEMLVRLGIRQLAYDWRERHVPTFEDEILQMKRHGIEFSAFWGTHPEFIDLMQKHQIRPQIWVMMHAPTQGTEEQKIEEAARRLLPLVEQTRQLGCRLALYNHGGWAGQPANMAAVARWLRVHHDADHVGIVYNLHHGHEHIAGFADALALMQAYLFCLNLNGMNDDEKPKILPVGQGQHDLALLRIIRDSGYAGPIGILDHRGDVDAEEALRANLDGLKRLLEQLGDQAALSTYR
jgi:sugar phosphate isomerase/epimerase